MGFNSPQLAAQQTNDERSESWADTLQLAAVSLMIQTNKIISGKPRKSGEFGKLREQSQIVSGQERFHSGSVTSVVYPPSSLARVR